jgi:CSLREA domain-containing protein
MHSLFKRVNPVLFMSILVVLVVSSTLMVKPVTAGTILVNSTLDIEANDGLCTLREAIKAANSDTTSGGRTGNVPPVLAKL